MTRQEFTSEKVYYYPFRLTHKGYNNEHFIFWESPGAGIQLVPVTPDLTDTYKYKFGSKEWQDELDLNYYDFGARNYDAALVRTFTPDPMAEVYYELSPYSFLNNNPISNIDPTGAVTLSGQAAKNWLQNKKDEIASKPRKRKEREDEDNDDIITVNSDGIITKIEPAEGSHRFFDEKGNELFFHDSDGVDNPNLNFEYRVNERLFYTLSNDQIDNHIINSGLIWQRFIPNTIIAGEGYYFWSLLSALKKGHSDYDFAEGYLVNFIKNPGRNDTKGRANYNEDAGYFRFGNTNSIYNLYDGGNYMWGRAMRMSGFSYREIRFGSQTNSIITTFTIDSEADQRAIKNGYYGN